MSTLPIIAGVFVGIVIIILALPFLIANWKQGKGGPGGRDVEKTYGMSSSQDAWDAIKPVGRKIRGKKQAKKDGKKD